ncbi:MAG: sugar phosphate isomerase/epimerase family protein [Trueperaceae bacterium]
MQTRTGKFPIGFRKLWMDWHKDVDGLLEWAKTNDLSVIDFGADGDTNGQKALDAGLKIGSVDLQNWQGLLSPDKTKREEIVAQNREYIQRCAKYGSVNYFIALLPEDPSRPRRENFEYAVESFKALTPVLESTNAHVVIEGWPGPGVLACTPEGYRAFFKDVHSEAMGVNFDPSHLLRMGIDPLRFLEEFKHRVYHVHGKDCEILLENKYEYGTEQEPTFAKPIEFGGMHWRYTIPGHGGTRWIKVFEILKANNYKGAVSIELEDTYFNGSIEGEKLGILQGAHFLSGC